MSTSTESPATRFGCFAAWRIAALSAGWLLPACCCAAETLVDPVDGVTASLDRWTTSDPVGAAPSWSIVETPDRGKVLRAEGTSLFKPDHRSPPNYAILDGAVVGDFTLTIDLQNTKPDAGHHRDLCLFFGYQDPNHYYYVHFGAVPDEHSCQVFCVDDAPRVMITENDTSGTDWTDGWHRARIERDAASGRIEVYFDDFETPAMVATDKSFTWGRIGVGTFDDHGHFDRLRLEGRAVADPPANE